MGRTESAEGSRHGPPARNQYLYDRLDVVEEIPSGAPLNYLRGLNVNEPWVRGAAEFYLADALGSVVALGDPAGMIQTQYTYGTFGATSTSGALSQNPFQFTGREADETGLYYYRARYYHPGLGRFIAEVMGGRGVRLWHWSASVPPVPREVVLVVPSLEAACVLPVLSASPLAEGSRVDRGTPRVLPRARSRLTRAWIAATILP